MSARYSHNNTATPDEKPVPSIGTYVGVSAAIQLAGLVVLTGAVLWSLNGVMGGAIEATESVREGSLPLIALTNDLDRLTEVFVEAIRFPETADEERATIVDLEAQIDARVAAIAAAQAAPGTDPEIAASLEDGLGAWERAKGHLEAMLATPPNEMVLESPTNVAAFEELNGARDAFRATLGPSLEHVNREFDAADTQREVALWVTGSVAAASILLVVVAGLRLRRTIVRPIRQLREAALHATHDDLRDRMAVEGPREIADLAAAFNTMIEEVHQRESQLVYRALHDPLTGLGNRSLMQERLRLGLARLRRHQDESLALMMVDLDGFKKVNDALGHQAGDEVIRGAAGRIQGLLRDGDTVTRLGGDEFAIIVEDVKNGASAVAARVCETLRETFVVGGHRATVSGSVGVATAVTGRETAEDLLRNADLAMYEAKRLGGNQVQYFAAQLYQRATNRMELEEDLRAALERGEIEVHYQPTVDLPSGVVQGVEALARWRHPTRGLLMPEEFIPLAEETGLIIPLGAQVLSRAAKDLVHWATVAENDEPFFVSVNVSARQLDAPDFVDQVREAIAMPGMDPSRLIVELTETAVLRRANEAPAKLAELRGLGVRVALDDFGTGYTSLNYLRQLPVDILKIDRSFVAGLAHREDLSLLVRTIVELAGAFHLDVVAEGVEEGEDVQALLDLGCEHAQGFALGHPSTVGEIDTLLHAAPTSIAARGNGSGGTPPRDEEHRAAS